MSYWNLITASMGVCIAIISFGWILNGCESCFFFGGIGIFIGALFFIYGIENAKFFEIDWNRMRKNISMPTNLWSDKKWVTAYWAYSILMNIYEILGTVFYFIGVFSIVAYSVGYGVIFGIFGAGIICCAESINNTLRKMVEAEQPKFKRRR
jgi:hypothetical protein